LSNPGEDEEKKQFVVFENDATNFDHKANSFEYTIAVTVDDTD
jgi:hypothetical protein